MRILNWARATATYLADVARHARANRKTLEPEERDYLGIYAGFGLWAVVLALFTPLTIAAALQAGVSYLWCLSTVIGALVSSLGLVARQNLDLELSGVWLVIIGPAGYGLVQLGLLVNDAIALGGIYPDSYQRAAPVVFAGVMCLFLRKRIRFLRRKKAIAARLPLPNESPR